MAQDRDAGRRRVVIEGIKPAADCGRAAIKRIIGDEIVVEADVFGDGHDEVRCLLLFRHESDEQWNSVPMGALGQRPLASGVQARTAGDVSLHDLRLGRSFFHLAP